MIHLVTFATDDMSRAEQLCVESAILKGGIGSNEIHRYTPWDARSLRESNPALFLGRGYGHWSWKPYLINKLTDSGGFLYDVQEGDIVVYADAGIEFINNVNHIIDRMDQDIFLFGNMWEHAHWCKRDIVEAIWPLPIDRQSFVDAGVQMSTPSNLVAFDVDGIESLYSWARFGKQVQASVIFFRVNDYTRRFVKEWLDWCLFEGGRLIDDSPSRTPNHPEFRENRHDQAILTTMAYREGLRLHWWPAMYNEGAFTYEQSPEYKDDLYPIMFHHHRRRNHEFREKAA